MHCDLSGAEKDTRNVVYKNLANVNDKIAFLICSYKTQEIVYQGYINKVIMLLFSPIALLEYWSFSPHTPVFSPYPPELRKAAVPGCSIFPY